MGYKKKLRNDYQSTLCLPAILEGIHQMDLKETVKTVIGIEGLKLLMKAPRSKEPALN